MYLRFIKVEIEGFQSIDQAELELDNQGIIFVKGINEYDEFTDSNGSGKSSIFESIYWAIFGKTTKGVSKVENRYINSGCCVSVYFKIDSDNYEIRRTINHKSYGTSLSLIQNGNDISGRNKTDTDKVIQNSVLKEFNQDIFLSIVFLSQGFNNRLSILSPSGRKDRLENLSQLSFKIDEFKSELSCLNDKYNNSILKVSQDLSKNTGERSSCEKELFRLEQIIKDAQQTNKPDIDLRETESKIEKFRDSSDKIEKSLNKYKSEKLSIELKLSSLNASRNSIIDELNKYKRMLLPVTSSICPTCNQSLNKGLSEKLIQEYKQRISTCKESLLSCDKDISELQLLLEKCNSEITTSVHALEVLNTKISELNKLIIEYLKVKDVSDEINHVKELKSQIHDLGNEISNFEQEKINLSDLKKVVEHCSSLVTKQFRNYLLEDIINFMNSRLRIYSELLYSNEEDIIYLKSESSKLDIYLGDAIYDTLSGGEGRKVDLALSLAQRDLALNISGSSSNILILDEIMDNLDDKAINSVTSMFVSAADDIDSMFIISHKPPMNVPYDSILTVIKNDNKISSIIRS